MCDLKRKRKKAGENLAEGAEKEIDLRKSREKTLKSLFKDRRARQGKLRK